MVARCPFAVLIAIASCSLEQSSNLRATRFGDTSHPATRGSPIAQLQAACGPGGLTPEGKDAITREPYLQRVAARSAMIGWVTTRPVGARVELTRPDGTVVATRPAAETPAAAPRPGEHQMWARLDGLSPDTIYCYAIVDDVARTTRTGFRTAPTADRPEPVRFVAFGDSAGGDPGDHSALRAQMLTVPFELVVHLGDIASHGTFAGLQRSFFGPYREILRSIPAFPIAGNHERDAHEGAPYRAVFAPPGAGPGSAFSFDWGRVHFAAVDTGGDLATQAAWLDRDLSATPLPWRIVYLHEPLYSTGIHGSDPALRGALAPILQKHGVQLVLCGHDHDYERTKPQHGIVYIVSGGGGHGTTAVGSSSFTAFSESVIHFLYVEVGEDQLVVHAIDGTGVEFDSVVIPRGR